MNRTRHWLAFIIVFSTIGIAISSIFIDQATSILSQFIPIVMLILGYYFGKKD